MPGRSMALNCGHVVPGMPWDHANCPVTVVPLGITSQAEGPRVPAGPTGPAAPAGPVAPDGPGAPDGPAGPVRAVSPATVAGARSEVRRLPFFTSLVVTVPSLICL